MNSQLRATGSASVADYVTTVATTLDAEAVQGWDDDAFDVVLTLPDEAPHYPGRKAVLAWNHHFGWSLGVRGLTPTNLVILDGLGVGRTPEPGRIADRVAELMAQVAECARPVWTPRPAN
ncbi:MAG: DUF6292 family protein, partial [Rhodococcus sp. (in: high G+C Gram-positive bacteria)]|uniref:DUF6292 family protein n=1 Tax=Rhodococcus sp. TaxID=1831 RepID=UPI003BAE34C5